jgi:hypothetical protein
MSEAQLKKLAHKYKDLDGSLITIKNELINSSTLHNNICNIMANKWENERLSQSALCTTLGDTNNLITNIINEKITLNNVNEECWIWAKAQIKVNIQRDKIDQLICELIQTILSNEKTEITEKTEIKPLKEEKNNTPYIVAALVALITKLVYTNWHYLINYIT